MRALFISAIITIFICVCAVGQEGETPAPKGLSGIVTDSQTNTPIFGARVEVLKDGKPSGLSARTDRDGKYVIENVPDGVFDLMVSRDKYIPKVISGVSVKEGEATTDINVAIQMITPIKVGDEERDFSLTSTDGKVVSLQDFKGKSIVVIGMGNPYT